MTAPAEIADDRVAIRGAVVDGAGAPVVNALVALLDERQTDVPPLTSTFSDDKGEFVFRVAPGNYGVSATAKSFAASVVCGLEVASNADAPNPKIVLGGSSNTIEGRLRDEPGTVIPNAEVLITERSGESCDGFVVRTGNDGRFRARVPPGGTVVAAAFGSYESRPHLQFDSGDASFDLMVYRRGSKDPAPAKVVEWVRDQAIYLKTAAPGSGFEDVEALRGVIGDARIVSLGEATHGTSEFLQLKHRMLEFLVEEMGFTAFVIEATMPEAFHINEYIEHGRGDPAKALAALYWWTWNTQEVLALIEWMRAYNADTRHTRKIRFYGNDAQYAPLAAQVAFVHLREVDPALAKSLAADLSVVTDEFLAAYFRRLPRETQEQPLVAAKSMLERLQRDSARYPKLSERDIALQHARVLVQFLQMSLFDPDKGWAVRDKAMADNTAWALEREGTDGKVVLWAHNGHVTRSPYYSLPSMGGYLDNRFGNAVRVFGFAFNSGRFQATDTERGKPSALREFEVPPAPDGSLDRMLSRAGSLFVLDLRKLPGTGVVANWFRALRGVRMPGSGYSDRELGLTKIRVQDDYDAVFFVNKTTAAHPNHPRTDVRTVIHPKPINLNFEAESKSATPRGWNTGRWLRSRGYTAQLDTERPHTGKRSIRIKRDNQRRYGFRPAEITQRIKAAPYAGKKLTISFHARATGAEPVYVFTQSPGPSGLQYKRVTAADWERHEITLDVPNATDGNIRFGLAVTGDSIGWLDSVSIATDSAHR